MQPTLDSDGREAALSHRYLTSPRGPLNCTLEQLGLPQNQKDSRSDFRFRPLIQINSLNVEEQTVQGRLEEA
jgi:hypothetical protein